METILRVDKIYLYNILYNNRKVSIRFDLEISKINENQAIPYLEMFMYDDGRCSNLTLIDLDKIIEENNKNTEIIKKLYAYRNIYAPYNGKRITLESAEYLYQLHTQINFEDYNNTYIENLQVTNEMIEQYLEYVYIHSPYDLVTLWNRSHNNKIKQMIMLNNVKTLKDVINYIEEDLHENRYSFADKFIWLRSNIYDKRYIQSFTDLNEVKLQLFSELKRYTDRYCNFMDKIKNNFK